MNKCLLFKDWIATWLEQRRKRLKESTYFLYQTQIRTHFQRFFGGCTVREITERRVQEMADQLAREGKARGTIRNIVSLVTSSLKAAQNLGYAKRWSFEIMIPQKYTKKSLEIMSWEDQERISRILASGNDHRILGIVICLNTGLRIGELCALQWMDLDLNREVLTVTKTLQRIQEEGKSRVVIGPPKSKSSFREIPLSSHLLDLLRRFDTSREEFYVLTNGPKPTEPRVYRKWFERFLERHHLQKIHFHGLRHTFATRCVENRAEYKTLSNILGHAQTGTTLDLYVHPQMEQKRLCVELIARNYK